VIWKVNQWWHGRNMATMLPRLFFQHFGPWCYAAHQGDDVVGFLSGFRSQEDPGQVYCHFVGVDPNYRCIGIGKAMYDRLHTTAIGAGCHEALAVTSPQNRGSIAFHLAMGFTPIEGPEEQDGVPYTPNYDGPGEDRVRFRMELVGLQ
jgi:GNAT superfamily N-acetyltransferase